MSKTDKLVITDKGKDGVLCKIFVSVFTLPTPPEWMDHETGTWGAKFFPQ